MKKGNPMAEKHNFVPWEIAVHRAKKENKNFLCIAGLVIAFFRAITIKAPPAARRPPFPFRPSPAAPRLQP